MHYRILAIAALAATAAFAESSTTNQIIVTATRIDTPVNQMASSVNVVTETDIENSGQLMLSDLLQEVPGISVSRSGGPGQATQVYLRGAKPQHTQILVDGVRMNGQLDLNGYDMANFQLLDIEQIEVLKGPHSPLYGSDAMAGVINIVTRKGKGKPTPYYDFEGGSYGTWRAATGVSGGDDRFNYNASVSHYDRQGQSALKNNTEKDGTENTTVATRLGFNPADFSEFTFTMRYIDATADYDNDFTNAFHSAYKYDTEQLITRVESTTLMANDLIESKAGISYLMLNRRNYGYVSTYDADTISVDWSNTIFVHDNHTLLFGIDGYYDEFQFNEGFGVTDDNLHNAAAFGSYQGYLIKPWVVNLGVRHDEHSEFSGETTYQASSAYTLAATGTKIKGSYGTGFKAPTSYQLYAPFLGNPNLKPEESEGWEIGIEQQIVSNRLDIGATYFKTDYDNMIDWYDPDGWLGPIPGSYANIAKASTEGVEVYGTATLMDNLSLRTGYTYLDNDDETGSTFHLKRPMHQVDAGINYAPTTKLNLNLSASYVGARKDIGNVEMDSYVLVNLAARYEVCKNVLIYGRIENLLDEDYETVAGYNTDSLSAYAGIKVSL